MRKLNKIVLATSNRDKIEEFQALFKSYSELEVIGANKIIRNPHQLQYAEKYSTYLENSIAKARLANQACHYPTLADDSGLEVEGLEGKPGVKSNRYAPPRPNMTQDQANVELLLKELQGGKSRKAKFVCTLALQIEGILIHASGELHGTISDTPRGINGFGYDPIFIPEGSNKTLAEMTAKEKNAISHRTQALKNLMTQVQSHEVVFAKP